MIAVVGASDAGLAAGIFARAGGRPVTVLKSTADGGRKIRRFVCLKGQRG